MSVNPFEIQKNVDGVPFHTIRPDRWIDFDVYTYDSEKNLQKILRKDELYSRQTRSKLIKAKNTKLFIRSDEKEAYYNYLEKNLKEMATDQNIPLPEKTLALYDGSTRILENIFNTPEDGKLHGKINGVVESAVDIVLSDVKAIKMLVDAGSVEYSNHTHSVDVAVYATGFGRYLGFSRNDMLKLGYAAMMHDIGKSRVDSAILNKKGGLNDDEFEQVKRHATYGYFILRAQNITDTDILGGVRYHHEKCDGSGYPEKRSASEIPLFAKIIALSDVFAALSAQREYKDACSSYEALLVMKDEMIHGFDKRLLLEFIRFMGPAYQQNAS